MDVEAIAARLPKSVVRALTEPGAPIPDSLWHGRYAHFKHCGPDGWYWSPLGLAVRQHLIEKGSQPRDDSL